MPDWRDALAAAAAGERLDATAAAAFVDTPTSLLCEAAQGLRRSSVITYSPKVFIPLTHLCRDVCHYCTFARPPRRGERAFMTEDEVVAVARAGAEAGCNEALFTLGDKPELRYRAAREELAALGCETTLEYLERCARLVLDATGLLPHVNAGVMGLEAVLALRAVSVSQGLMLEGSAPALAARGGPHFGSPDKRPEARLATIAAAGQARVPFTSGILIGIGETRAERLDALLAIRDQHDRYGHVQEVIVQNFRAKPGTKMADHPEPALDEVLWSAAAARLVLGSDMHIQVPPNLSEDFGRLLDAGIDDWGGISPVTIDHVNPEAPWPAVAALEDVTRAAGLELAPRLPIYPAFVRDPGRWLDDGVVAATLRRSDALGLGREDSWSAGAAVPVPARTSSSLVAAVERVERGRELREDDLVAMLTARGRAAAAVCAAADDLRRQVNGDYVTYVVTRNVNYTNVCYFRCGFCAFSKGKLAASLRGRPYLVPHAEVARRAREAWERGATEVCLQGGIHPGFTGRQYLEVCRAVKDAVPDIHVHAFSALEIWQGASTLRMPLERYLAELREAGLSSLPGTAAEILDDEVRRELCPDKVTTDQWLHVHETAHRAGLRSTATIMFGHIDRPWHVARHLLRVRDLQRRTGGFTELVPLPFVHMEAPIYLKGKARPGPTFREAILLHAVARLALHPEIPNIQASWVKLGLDGAGVALQAGCNDLGGTLMNESISRAAGASHGEEVPPERMDEAIRTLGRTPRRRTTLYGEPPAEQVARSYDAPPLSPPVNPPVKDAQLVAPPRLVRPGFAGAARC